MIYKIYIKHQETFHNFFWRSLQIFGKQGVTFLIFIICAKLLTPYDFGIYNYILDIVFFLIMFGDFGISTATSKYVAEFNVANKEKLKSILFSSGALILVLSVVVTILTLIAGPWYLKDKYIYVLYLLPLVFLAPITSLYDGIYRGLKKFKQLAIISSSVGLLSLSFIYFLIKNYGLTGALISQNIFYFLLFLALAFRYKEFDIRIKKEVIKEIGKYSLIVGLGSLGLYLYTRVDLIFLGAFGFIEEVGLYEFINRFISIIMILPLIFATVIAPNITKLHITQNYFKLRQLFRKILIISSLFGILVVIVFIFIGPLISSFFFVGDDLSNLRKMLYILLPVLATQSLTSITPVAFAVSTGNADISTKVLIFFGILNCFLNYIFIIKFGYIGILYSTLICKISADFIFTYLLYKRLFN